LYQQPQPNLLVLDGQQRLTSLLYALTAPPKLGLKDSKQQRLFFVNLDLLRTNIDDDGIVFERPADELEGLDSPEVQYKQHILPATKLLALSAFYGWRDGLEDWLANDAVGYATYREEWRGEWNSVINNFLNFEVPVVELPSVSDDHPVGMGRVCAIFEKLNSTGVELSVYDLLTARLYRSGTNLHELWKDTCSKHKLISQWSKGKADTNKFGVLILRTLALLRGKEVKPAELINLDPNDFAQDWQRAATGFENALALITNYSEDGFGVFDNKYLPGYGLIPVLAALRAEIDQRKLGNQPRADLRRWYWCNVFLERYSSAVESKSRKDYVEMLAHWIGSAPEPSVFAEAQARIGADGYTIRGSASYASAVYSGVFCLLALNGARDWRRGESIGLQQLQDHHIFPQDYLQKRGVTGRNYINSVANRTLISDETNNKIKNKAPATYIESADIFPSHNPEALLAPHFIDADAFSAMQMATEKITTGELNIVYEEFCKAREAAIIAMIRKRCGVSGILIPSSAVQYGTQVDGEMVSANESKIDSANASPFNKDDGESAESAALIRIGLNQDFTGKKPYSFSYAGKDFGQVGTWKGLYILLCHYLFDAEPAKFANLPLSRRFGITRGSNKGNNWAFAYSSAGMTSPLLIGGVYVETNCSANTIRDAIKELLLEFGLDPSKFEVYIRLERQ